MLSPHFGITGHFLPNRALVGTSFCYAWHYSKIRLILRLNRPVLKWETLHFGPVIKTGITGADDLSLYACPYSYTEDSNPEV